MPSKVETFIGTLVLKSAEGQYATTTLLVSTATEIDMSLL